MKRILFFLALACVAMPAPAVVVQLDVPSATLTRFRLAVARKRNPDVSNPTPATQEQARRRLIELVLQEIEETELREALRTPPVVAPIDPPT